MRIEITPHHHGFYKCILDLLFV